MLHLRFLKSRKPWLITMIESGRFFFHFLVPHNTPVLLKQKQLRSIHGDFRPEVRCDVHPVMLEALLPLVGPNDDSGEASVESCSCKASIPLLSFCLFSVTLRIRQKDTQPPSFPSN